MIFDLGENFVNVCLSVLMRAHWDLHRIQSCSVFVIIKSRDALVAFRKIAIISAAATTAIDIGSHVTITMM